MSPVSADTSRIPVRLEGLQKQSVGVVLHGKRNRFGFPVVQWIKDNSILLKRGDVRPGDEIYSINGQSLQGRSISETQAFLEEEHSGTLVFEFQRRLGDEPIIDRFITVSLVGVILVLVAALVMSGHLPEYMDSFRHGEVHDRVRPSHIGPSDFHHRQHFDQHRQGRDQHFQQHQQHHDDALNGHPRQDQQRADARSKPRRERRRRDRTNRGGSRDNKDEMVRPQDMQDLYTLLGVPRGATDSEIRKSYRKLSRTAHPDKGGSPQQFQELQRAYEILSNGDLRFLYDLHPFEPGRGMDLIDEFLEFEDIKAHHRQAMNGLHGMPGAGFFPGMPPFEHRNPLRGEEDHRDLEVDLGDVYSGRTVSATFDRVVHCRGCRGKSDGFGIDESVDCGLCQRDRCPLEKKVVERPHPVIHGMVMTQQVEVASQERCRRERFSLDVEVPRGAPDDFTLRFPRQSHHNPGVIPGDLVVHLRIKEHPQFKFDPQSKNLDLQLQLQLDLQESLLGFNHSVLHLDGSRIYISSAFFNQSARIAKVTPHGHRHIVKGKGMPPPPRPASTARPNRRTWNRYSGSDQQPGNLVVEFLVNFPDGILSNASKDILRQALGA